MTSAGAAAGSDAIFPAQVLRNALRSPVCVELKNGTTYNGTLMAVDKWMNADLHQVISTSADGVRFFKHREVCIRGNQIRTVRVTAEAFDPPKRAPKPGGKQQGHRHGGGGGAARPTGPSREQQTRQLLNEYDGAAAAAASEAKGAGRKRERPN